MGKLMKNEAKRILRVAMPLMIAIAAMALLAALLFGIPLRLERSDTVLNNGYSTVFVVMYTIGALCVFGCIIAAAALPFYIYSDYYKSMFTDEAYLTHVLPYKTEKIFYSKFLTGLIGTALLYVYTLVCAMVALLIGFLVSGYSGSSDVPVEPSLPGYIVYDAFDYLTLATAIVNTIVGFAAGLAIIYAIITAVSLFVKRRRLAVGVCIYFGVNFIGSILFEVVALTLIAEAFSPGSSLYNSGLASFLQVLFQLLYNTALFLVSFLLTRHLLNKKLNIE